MIRDVLIHIANEQPLRADLQALPSATDACLVCTNLRMLDGKKPTFIERSESWFLIPLVRVAFVEMPAGAGGDLSDEERVALGPGEAVEEEPELELDEDLLRRIRET